MKKIVMVFLIGFLMPIGQAGAAVKHYNVVTLGKTVVVPVESVDTPEARAKGLQERQQLFGGMLFIHQQPEKLRYWMKGMKIPLDMIWIDADKKIVDISKNVPVCTADPCPAYHPKVLAQYVLEVNAGFVAKHNVKKGMTVNFS